MKKITLLAAAVLMVNAATASEVINTTVADRHANFSFNEPIAFMERGIEFFVFPNGEFDFNTEPTTGSDVYYRNGRRNTVNTTYGAPGNNGNGGIRIDHDALGRVRRIGNVFINYDRDNRIKRIGSVYMSYNREMLTQVGGLRIVYNRRGEITDMVGNVNGQSQYAYNDSYYGPSAGNNDNYYYKKATVAVKK
jgi:hypothetical protein